MERAKKVMEGDIRVASALIRNLEDRITEAKTTIKGIYPHTGKAHVIGFTGSPGAGKSTIIDAVITAFRKRNKTVGVLLIDPTSPFTGGAILGDRVRMQRHAQDSGVFVRSMASRGALGGLSKAVGDAIHVLDAMGKDIIIVETVGAGQQGIDVINHAHTVVVVQVPGMGDEIQVLKAGILEIADVFIINKGDRDGAGKIYQELMNMLNMVRDYPGGWRPPIVMAGNVSDGDSFVGSIEKLTDTVCSHYQNLVSKGLLGDRVRRKVMVELDDALESAVIDPIVDRLSEAGGLERMIEKIVRKESDPGTLADEIAKRYLRGRN